MSACKTFSHQSVHQLLDECWGGPRRPSGIASLAECRAGGYATGLVWRGARLAMVWRWRPQPECRHASNRFDRSAVHNPGIDVDPYAWRSGRLGCGHTVAPSSSLTVPWTGPTTRADNQATIMRSLTPSTAAPLRWSGCRHQGRTQGPAKPSLTPRVGRPGRIVQPGVGVCIGRRLELSRSNLTGCVTGSCTRVRHPLPAVNQGDGASWQSTAPLRPWVSPSGRARVLRGAMVTAIVLSVAPWARARGP